MLFTHKKVYQFELKPNSARGNVSGGRLSSGSENVRSKGANEKTDGSLGCVVVKTIHSAVTRVHDEAPPDFCMPMCWDNPQIDLSHKIVLKGDKIIGCYLDKQENLLYIGFDGEGKIDNYSPKEYYSKRGQSKSYENGSGRKILVYDLKTGDYDKNFLIAFRGSIIDVVVEIQEKEKEKEKSKQKQKLKEKREKERQQMQNNKKKSNNNNNNSNDGKNKSSSNNNNENKKDNNNNNSGLKNGSRMVKGNVNDDDEGNVEIERENDYYYDRDIRLLPNWPSFGCDRNRNRNINVNSNENDKYDINRDGNYRKLTGSGIIFFLNFGKGEMYYVTPKYTMKISLDVYNRFKNWMMNQNKSFDQRPCLSQWKQFKNTIEKECKMIEFILTDDLFPGLNANSNLLCRYLYSSNQFVALSKVGASRKVPYILKSYHIK